VDRERCGMKVKVEGFKAICSNFMLAYANAMTVHDAVGIDIQNDASS
jgi:hypothetical protein